ncbi:MAG: glutamate formimidoyltransferase [Dethiosulfovibrio peptidovorans]|nr:MAG: glutamate formimidoyltransferase [Dethiosulfovibrio peptidovorans]
MSKILLCELNVSEGTNAQSVASITKALTETPNITVMDVDSDKDHNRTVYTWIGAPEAVLQGAMNVTEKAVELIDMTQHVGRHPRMGAVDVVPFVPVRNVDIEEALGIARRYGAWLGSLGVPVYYYEEAATTPERQSLVSIRKGQYEALPEKMKDDNWRPDEGPFAFVPKSGATVTGVRFPLVAYNVNLRTDDIEIGKEIARRMRHSSGGLRYVRAIALPLEERNMVQVSMNLTNYEKTPIPVVYNMVSSLADIYGVAIAEAELVGPVPLSALQDVVRMCLRVHNFDVGQIIETNLLH